MRSVQIPGTKLVPRTSQMLVSSGIPALDEILGKMVIFRLEYTCLKSNDSISFVDLMHLSA